MCNHLPHAPNTKLTMLIGLDIPEAHMVIDQGIRRVRGH